MEIPSNLSLYEQKNINAFNTLVDKAEEVLYNSRFPHYTDHSIAHSNRVLSLASSLLPSSIHLSEDERFILLCAIILHDIGMQVNIYLDATFPLNNEQLEAIRSEHHELSYKYIIDEYVTLGLNDKGFIVQFIAEVAKNHRVTDLNSVKENEYYQGKQIRLQLLSSIIRLADCLDCDFRRVKIDQLKSFQIESKSKAYWFCNRYISSVRIANKKINLTFAFPDEYKGNRIDDLIVNFMVSEVKTQTDLLYDIFIKYDIAFHRELVSVEKKYSKAVEKMPEDAYRYIYDSFKKDDEIVTNKSVQKREKKNDHLNTSVPIDWVWINDEHKNKHFQVSDDSVRRFLEGERCKWGLVYNAKLVRRDIVNEMKEAAVNGGITVFLGAGGEGKSTALMQMCVELSNESKTVLYHDNDKSEFELLPYEGKGIIFVVDNPPNNSSFADFYKWIIQKEYTLIIGCRANEWSLVERRQSLPDRTYSEITMSQLTSEEAERFANCIELYVRGISRSHEELIQLFEGYSYGFLYASMLLTIHNSDNLEKIAEDIIRRLMINSPDALKFLANIVLAEHMFIPFAETIYSHALRKYALSKNRVSQELRIEVKLSGLQYETRHKVISDLFYQVMFIDNVADLLPEDMNKNNLRDSLLDFSSEIFKSFLELKIAEFSKNNQKARPAKEIISDIATILTHCHVTCDEETVKYLLELSVDFFKQTPFYLEILLGIINENVIITQLLQICYYRKVYSPALLLMMARNTSEINIETREVYRKVLDCDFTEGSVWLAWARFEEKDDNIGSVNNPKEHTARWIYREAARVCGLSAGEMWVAWAQLEADQKNIGDITNPKEYTARWIYREATLEIGLSSGGFWRAWAQLEEKEQNIGSFNNPRKYSTRWIYREAAYNIRQSVEVWWYWARFEEERQNFGDFDNPEEYTVRWIYREATQETGLSDWSIWQAWARFEEERQNFGDFDNPEEYTVRWIYRKVRQEIGLSDWNILRTWARFEEERQNIGDFDNPERYTARWIFREGLRNKEQYDSSLWQDWIIMELAQNNLVKAREMQREMFICFPQYPVYITIIEILCDNFTSKDQYNAYTLMDKMKEALDINPSVLVAIYKCSVLLELNTEANDYYDKLLKRGENNRLNSNDERYLKKLEEYITQVKQCLPLE